MASSYGIRIRGKQAVNLEKSIEHYKQALEVHTRDAFPERWARTQTNLGWIYSERICGVRADNLEQALYHCKEALKIYTHDAFPEDWALVQNNLGFTYTERIHGVRAKNFEEAIQHYQQALEVYKRIDFPEEWARIQDNLGDTYRDRIFGKRAENLEQAINHHQLALEIYTHTTFPERWARVKSNLGLTYKNRIHGDRAQNLEQAIRYFQQALEIFTHSNFPDRWATTNFDIANSFRDRICGDRAKNLERALQHCQEALKIHTRDTFPLNWAGIQNSLGRIYKDRIRADRAENIERAIHHHQQAKQIFTLADFPKDWALVHNNLGNTFLDRIDGKRADNVEQAIHHYQQALIVHTHTDFPEQWARVQNNLGVAYRERFQGEKADNLEDAIQHYQQALEVYTYSAYPEYWAMVPNNLGTTHSERIRGMQAENIERAIDHYQQALKVYTCPTFPEDWAMTQISLGVAYSHRIRGLRAANLKLSADYCRQAVEIYTRTGFPAEYRRTEDILGYIHLEQEEWLRAHTAYTEAIETGANLLAEAYTDHGRRAEVNETSQLYANDAYCLVRLGRFDDALMRLEQGKTRLLNETLALAEIDLALLPEADQTAIIAARHTIQALEASMRTPEDTDTHRRNRALADDLRQARTKLNQLIETIRKANPEFLPHDLTLTELLALIPEGGALVAPFFTTKGSAVFVLPHETATVTEAHVIALDGFTDADLDDLLTGPDDEQELSGWIGGYVNYHHTPPEEGKNPFFAKQWFRTLETTGESLWDRLIEPIHERLKHLGLKSGAPVLLMPQGGLGLLPLHAAWHDVDGQKRYFLDDWTVTYVPSGYALTVSRQRLCEPQRQEHSLLSVINPTGDLPFTVAEGQAIRVLFSNVRSLEEDSATIDAVLVDAPGRQYLHFACHGGFGWNDVMESRLILADGEPLTLSEIIADFDVSTARLVTLSACETGITDISQSPDEYLGLPAGFLQAGAPAVISSLWPVNDRSTRLLMERFYQNLLGHEGSEPQPPAAALCAAQRWLRDITISELQEKLGDELSDDDIQLFAAEISHPHHWAAFTFSGA